MTSDPVLRGIKVFVGGPIQHAILPGGFLGGLRDSISTAIHHVETAGAIVLSAHVVEKFGVETASFTPAQVSVRDLGWMRECDVFVPVLPVLPDGMLLRTDGTHVELGWASALGRPVIGITRQPFAESASHLLKGLSQVASVEFVDDDKFTADPACLVNRIASVLGRTSKRDTSLA